MVWMFVYADHRRKLSVVLVGIGQLSACVVYQFLG